MLQKAKLLLAFKVPEKPAIRHFVEDRGLMEALSSPDPSPFPSLALVDETPLFALRLGREQVDFL